MLTSVTPIAYFYNRMTIVQVYHIAFSHLIRSSSFKYLQAKKNRYFQTKNIADWQWLAIGLSMLSLVNVECKRRYL